jgi:hypothetical protein
MPIPTPNRALLTKFVSVFCLLTAPLWLYFLLFPADYDYANGIVVFLIVLVVDVGLILHVSGNDEELRKIMTTGLFLKLFAAAVYMTFMIHYYQGGDFLFYFSQGSNISQSLIHNGEIGRIIGATTRERMNGTTLLHIITGVLFVVTGPTLSGAIVIFSSIAYWGVFLFWKAFSTAFPGGDHKKAAVLLFFLPSIVYWSSTIGKDALLSFSIGLTAYGLAIMVYGARIGGLAYIAFGMFVTAAIRPHIAAVLAISLAVTYLLGQNRAGIAGVIAKMIGIPLIIAGTYYVFTEARDKLGVQDAEHAQKYVNSWSEVTAYGGSSFQSGSLTKRILLAPALPFRPFPWEINSVQTLIAGAEGMFLLALFWIDRRGLRFSLTHWRSHPFVGFILFFSLETAVALSCAFSNFGLLARERVMFTPLLLMLVAAFPAVQSVPTAAPRLALQYGRAT